MSSRRRVLILVVCLSSAGPSAVRQLVSTSTRADFWWADRPAAATFLIASHRGLTVGWAAVGELSGLGAEDIPALQRTAVAGQAEPLCGHERLSS